MTMASFASASAFALVFALSSLREASGFDISNNNNLALYWGQNSFGATDASDTADWQHPIGFYCTSDSVTDTFPIAFLTEAFGEGGLPSIDLANTCNENDNATFAGTELPDCSSLASGIEACQAAGKIVTLSIGGATGAVTLTSDAEGETFADNIWNLFLGGTSSTRPFGSAILDGIDLDIEGGGTTGYEAFINRIRSHAEGASKQYYITAAPQCPFPDANLGTLINAVGFDAIYVQFYNNFCGLQNFDNSNAWNFDQWDDWAKNTSPNPDVKIYIGAPASSSAAGSGYVDASTLANIIEQTRAQFSSFGGVMMWDASQAYANDRYDIAAKNAMGGSVSVPSSTSTTSAPSTTSTTSSPTTSTTASVPASSGCAGVAAWSSTTAYVGGDEVTYNDQLWTAKWWTYNDTPGGVAGVWTDDGACTSEARVTVAVSSETSVSVSAVATPPSDQASSLPSAAHGSKGVAASPSPSPSPSAAAAASSPPSAPASASASIKPNDISPSGIVSASEHVSPSPSLSVSDFGSSEARSASVPVSASAPVSASHPISASASASAPASSSASAPVPSASASGNEEQALRLRFNRF